MSDPILFIFQEMRRRVKGILMSGKQFSLDSRMDLVSSALEKGTVSPETFLREESVENSEDNGV